MHYWNQPNFEGLRALSAELGAHGDLAQLAAYCRLRDEGLRREAFAALNSFLATAGKWERRRSQEAVETVLTLHARTPDCHQFLTQPLLERFIFPVLRQWAEHEPGCRSPIRWLGILQRQPDQLAQALAADPRDIEVRRLLISLHLDRVDHATHHLGEGLFLGEVHEALEDLRNATRLFDEAPDRDLVADLHREALDFGQMLADWQAYQALPTGTFVEWCAARGRRYGWPVAVYYGDGKP